MKKRGQIALEYLIIVGIILALLSPLIYSQINEYIIKQRLNNAKILANDIAKAADVLYSLGPGNQKYLYINVPKGIVDMNIYKREISFTMQTTQDQTQEIILLTQGYVTGVISTSPGTNRISIQVLEDGTVLIGDPYCSIKTKLFCNNETTLNPIVYLDSPSNAMASLSNNSFNYTICCKNTIEMGEGDGQTPLFWMNNELSSHVSETQSVGYNISAMIHRTTSGEQLNCEYLKRDEFDFCPELGQDYYCIATLEDSYYNSTTGEWVEGVLSNSHISDCDSDFDDYPIRLCCTIPVG